MGTRFIEGFTFNFFSVYLLAYVVTNLGLPRSLALGGVMVGAALGRRAGADHRCALRPGRPQAGLPGRGLAGAGGRVPGGRPRAVRPTASRSSSVFVVGLGLLYGTIYGPLAAFWSELFDTRYRYTALSTLYQVSGIVASGLTPLIAAWLVSRGGGSLWLVAGYNVVVAAISLTSRAVPARDPRAGTSTRRPRPRGRRPPWRLSSRRQRADAGGAGAPGRHRRTQSS